MPTEYLQQIAEANSWGAIGPELALGILALLLLALEVLLPKVAHGDSPNCSNWAASDISQFAMGRNGRCGNRPSLWWHDPF